MKTTAKDVQAYLRKHGPSSTFDLRARLDPNISIVTFRRALNNMEVIGRIKNTMPKNKPALWVLDAPQPRSPSLTPARQYDMLRAPLLVPPQMQPARPGAADHTQFASRRGDAFVPHQTPIHMCSQLKGSM